MKKIVLMCLFAILSISLLTGCGQKGKGSASKTLNIFTWDGYFPPDVLEAFTKDTGIKINYANFENNEEMLAKLQANGKEYDLILASDYIIDIARQKDGLLEELDISKIPNYKNIDANFQSKFYDPDNKYTIPYGAGTPLIIYDSEAVDIDIKGFNDLWNPALKDSIVAMNDQRNIIGMTLKSMGKSFNTTDEAVLDEAKAKLMELKPNIRTLSYDNPQGAMISGEASVGYMFTPQILEVLAAKPEFKVVYPEEGMGFGIDNIFMSLSAPNKENAYQFINYILDAQVGASISSQINYICANKAAQEYLPEEYKQNKSLYIPSEILGQTEFIQDVGEATAIYDKIWTEFGLQ